MRRSIVAGVAAVLVAVSVSGATEQPSQPIEIRMPAPHSGTVSSGPFSPAGIRKWMRPLGRAAPHWARRLYGRSVRVLTALTDPQSGAMIAGERDGWDYVWPRDASAGSIAFEAAGLHPEAQRVVGFLSNIDPERAARFYPDGSPVPGRPAAGDAVGWIAAAAQATTKPSTFLTGGRTATVDKEGPWRWRDRQDYGENVTGDLLGNAIAAGALADEVNSHFLTLRGLAREEDGDELDSAAAWAVTLFPQPGLRVDVRRTLLELTRHSTPYGIPPMESWTPGEVWTAPTAWSAWALVELGETRAADRLLHELHRAETPDGTLPERVDASTGEPTSTTPLAWSHAFAILALSARYPG